MDKYKIQVYLDRELYESLVSGAKAENLSISRYAERLLAEKARAPVVDVRPEAIESLLQAHLSPIKEAIARLVSQGESPSPVSQSESPSPVSQSEPPSPVSQSESPSPVSQSESPDLLLQKFYAVVLLVDRQIVKWWDGRMFSVNPLTAKIYKKPPTPKMMESLEGKASSLCGEARYNDLLSLLNLKGYPHNNTRYIEKIWIEKTLDG